MIQYTTAIMRALRKTLCLCLLLPLWLTAALAEEPAQPDLPPEISYFDDAVFLGDSITNQIRRYRTARRDAGEEIFGSARFLSAGAYSLYLAGLDNALKDQPALLYRGRNVGAAQGLAAMEAGKVFILLGLADDPGYNPERDMQRYTKVINSIRDALPEAKIVAMSLTPITQKGQNQKTTQKGINLFNANLHWLCNQLGIIYLDVAEPLTNDQGYLDGAYSIDKKVHLNEEGLAIQTDILHEHARQQLLLDQGTDQP